MKSKRKTATMSFEHENQNGPDLFVELGRKFELLGKALQNKDSLLTELSDRAFDCGLHLHFGLEDKDKPTVSATTLREECDRFTDSEKKLKDELSRSLHELSIIKAMTGVVKAEWRGEGYKATLHSLVVGGAPFQLSQVQLDATKK